MPVLKQRLTDDMKAAMKGGDKPRLAVIRLINAAIKQREVDERVEMDDEQVLAILDKMVKQRRDSIAQYEQAGRTELADQEQFEIGVIQDYLPAALSEAEIAALVDEAIAASDASGMQAMGKIMAALKPKLQGRADIGAVSALVKQKLAG
jgi:uncharacterized protein YqeY